MEALSVVAHPVSIPYINNIPAGFPSPAADYSEEEINLNQLLDLSPSTYIIRIKGDSMAPTIPDGCFAVVDRSLTAKPQSIIVAVINGDFTVKRLLKLPRTWVLAPDNKMYDSYSVKEEDIFEVWGVITSLVVDIKSTRYGRLG